MADWTIHQGDCIAIMQDMPDNSFDAVVTDPPYELGFMGKSWDRSGVAFQPETWAEVLRLLKPGGHLLAFGGTRTYHRMASAIEDAGFEIRDCLQWLYGSGFPKSLDVSKAIDKAAGVPIETRGHFQYTQADAAMTPGAYRTNEERQNPGERRHKPATEAAKEWDGWGTALKPANEPIALARKSLSEPTVAANVQKWGTGALNIDGCRIQTKDDLRAGSGGLLSHIRDGKRYRKDNGGTNFAVKPGPRGGSKKGRWPANVLLDEEAAAVLDDQTGDRPSGSRQAGVRKGMGYHGAEGDGGPEIDGSIGGASRFFYCAKASREERNRNLSGPEKPLNWSSGDQNPGSFQSGGTKRAARNHHPTVKPVNLMRYLCRLVTPPNGRILDPFSGSGTTLIAAIEEGFNVVGIESEREYCEIARGRLSVVQVGMSF